VQCKGKNQIGFTQISRCQPCSKYVYTGARLYGDQGCIPERYNSGKGRVAVVLSLRLWDQVVKVHSWCELVVIHAY